MVRSPGGNAWQASGRRGSRIDTPEASMPRSTTKPEVDSPTPPHLSIVEQLAAEAEAVEPVSVVAAAAAAAEPSPEASIPAPEVIATAEAMRAAREVLEKAEQDYHEAEALAGRAASEDQKRRDHEEDIRIAGLQADLPWYFEQANHDMLLFRAEVIALSAGSTMERVIRRWIVASATREIVRRILVELGAHANKRSHEDYRLWDMRVASWQGIIDAAISRLRGGTLDSDEDDLDALAAANALIAEQSADAPLGPIERRPTDRTAPGPVALGLVNRFPNPVQNPMNFLPLDFSGVFNEALIAASLAQAKVVMPRSSGLPPTNFPFAEQLPRLIAGSKVKLATLRRPDAARDMTTTY